jgi:hypothetical protein
MIGRKRELVNIPLENVYRQTNCYVEWWEKEKLFHGSTKGNGHGGGTRQRVGGHMRKVRVYADTIKLVQKKKLPFEAGETDQI